MKKKLFLTALLALMMLSAVACGKREEDSSVQPPVTSENSELSEAPETSEKPESSEAPETSEKLESSEAPETSEKPESSEPPVTSEKPESSEPPVTSENSELSEAPETSEKPESSEPPETSEKLESSEPPETSEKPESSEGGEKEEIYYTVTFDSDGGSEVASITILAGEKVSKPTDPQKSSSLSEYEFLYWEYNGEEWNFEKNVVTGDLTLVAKWKKVTSYTPPFLPKD